jgi:hypothetical protein
MEKRVIPITWSWLGPEDYGVVEGPSEVMGLTGSDYVYQNSKWGRFDVETRCRDGISRCYGMITAQIFILAAIYALKSKTNMELRSASV